MALSQQMSVIGLQLNEAYIRATPVTSTGGEVFVLLETFANASHRTTNRAPLSTAIKLVYIDADTLPENEVSEVYQYLKSLPEFAGALDI